ncbi:MAG: ribbon-helix-helix domain-containing protein [Candidatus Woesearchaeota archaeon]
MVVDMISLKLEREFLKDVDSLVKKEKYQNRTELIRTLLREKLEKSKQKEYLLELLKLKGKSNKKTTDEEIELMKKKAFEELYDL